jgi:hypothetical protein
LTNDRAWTPPPSVKAGAACGSALAVVTAALYSIGSGRSLDYDSNITVGAFVKTGSLLDPLRRQIQLNNHPLFSILEHIVWSLGFHSETYLRVLPILFGAMTVALVTAWCVHRWGFVPGLSAGALVAANPLFASLSRSVRGYSLLTLCAVAATIVLWHMLESPHARNTPWIVWLYVGLVAAGISTHLYGCVVLVVHAAIVVVRSQFDATWFLRWTAGLFLGGAIYLKTLHTILNTHNMRTFHEEFPRELATVMLGQARVAVAVLGVIVLSALWLVRKRTELLAGTAAVAIFAVFVWVVVQPQFLVVRYFIWLVPGVALAAAFLVVRRPVAIVLVVVAVTAMVAHQWTSWTEVEVASSETAAVVDAARAQGMRVCGYLHTGVAVLAYTRQPARTKSAAEAASCDLVVGFYVTRKYDRLARLTYSYTWKIPGQYPAFIYSRRSEATVTAGMKHKRLDLDTHARTWPS